ncbi:MAG: 50S ribosomal protein L11 methyltransferase [Bacteroidetes bacterium]|nr:50S ribosomal protein L11 methyltransferase [Bacteroidota bacterium]
MEYIEVIVSGISGDNAEILTAGLIDLGFESFSEESSGLFSAYIPLDAFDIMKVANFLEEKAATLGFTYKVEKIAEQNWNAVWESAYQPVRIGTCFIRAPFHEPDPAAELDLVIEPKMSFGTAHHETTRLMIEALLQIRFDDSLVLDIGTGTGVLGIIAAKLGAKHVVAIDNDEWSFLNAKENASRNNVPGMLVIHGDAADIPAGEYGFILANINRNVLLRDIPVYHSFLGDGGLLLLSGFYEEDLGLISEAAESLGMKQIHHFTLNHWVVVNFKKC